jgi:integrase
MNATQKNKASKGSVGIESFRGKLRLRLPRAIDAYSRYISTGLQDTPENRKKVQVKAWEIEEDIATGHLDLSLEKYKIQNHLTVVQAIKPKPALSLAQLWELYVEYKAKNVSTSTLKNTYKAVASHIQKLPSQSLEKALEIRDYLVSNLKAETAKKYLIYIAACCDWAVEYGHISTNPFLGMAKKIKVIPKQVEDIKPFTKQERDAIITAFETDTHYSHYTSYVKFLFLTGCRTSEAIGLQWRYISPDCKKITFAEAYVRGTRKETKTGKPRIFPCNSQLQEFLKSIKPEKCDPEQLVFPSPEGKEIDDHNFLNRAWKGYKNRHGNQVDGVVTRLVKQGLVSEYRTQYNTRHTFITMALEAGVSVVQVSKWVGNTPEIIMKHYAGTIRQVQVPEF